MSVCVLTPLFLIHSVDNLAFFFTLKEKIKKHVQEYVSHRYTIGVSVVYLQRRFLLLTDGEQRVCAFLSFAPAFPVLAHVIISPTGTETMYKIFPTDTYYMQL